MLEVAPGLALLASREEFRKLVGAVSSEGRSEQGRGTQNGPLPHIGSIEEAFCPPGALK